MYLSFFGLAEKPFAITPDPRYLYLSARHADALAHLVYGITEAGGFIQLTGEVGTGKTTTIRSLLARVPQNAEIALIINPKMSPLEFLQTICEELGIGVPDSAEGNTRELVGILNRYLLRAHAAGRRVVLVVDEAQNLTPTVLEQVRLLTNLETETQKLLQIILIGQPELRELLARNDLRQLAQRITARFHLDPLSRDETHAYVQHRLRIAGATSEIFTRPALAAVYHISGGVPRVINILCDRALLGAYTEDQHQVSQRLVRRAGREIIGETPAPGWARWAIGALSVGVLAGGALVAWRFGPWRHAPGAAAAPAPAALLPAAPIARSPALPDLAGLLTRNQALTGADTAFAQLFALWHASYTAGGTDGCTQAERAGLACLAMRGSAAELRLMQRPAILMLTDAVGTPHQVVLTGLDDERAELRFGADTAIVGIADLTRFWFGDLVLLWRPAVPVVKDLAAGARGPAVRALRTQLAQWGGEAANTAASMVFDAALTRQLEEFQRRHHLPVDGVAGLETQVVLDAAVAAPETPLLRTRLDATLPAAGAANPGGSAGPKPAGSGG
ncbi:MAG: AAA family ATPase [Gammaproteobacteria bacterium]|nr:AAA family ATPase [Gammaproteobacteria bacterium]